MKKPERESQFETADRNLLFGILAWQAGVLTEAQLLAAMQQWTFSKDQSLGSILVRQTILTPVQLDQLNQMVGAHLQLHDGQAENALSNFSSVPNVTVSLKQQVDDSAIQASLRHFATDCELETAVSTNVANRTTTIVRGKSSDDSRYRIIRPHARGGLGEVFVASDTELNREVAIKEIQRRFADQTESRGRFILEAEVTGGLEHPGIVPVYGLGQYDDGRPYYAMRFIKGDSLQDAIKTFHRGDLTDTQRNLELRKLLGRFTDVCEAIGYAHSRGVLHRDLKPGNIMLGKYGETLVVDWGLAKVAGTDDSTRVRDEKTLNPSSGSSVHPTVFGNAMGTPAYMPPEQAAGRLDAFGPASDVYSLGATLYHLLTGVPPFSRQDVDALLKKVQRGDFRRPRQENPSLSASLEAICLKAMSLEPEDRYASPQALASDIERFLADEPVTAIVEPVSVRIRRWTRKHQTLVSTVAATVLMATAAAGLFFRVSQKQAFRDKQNADRIAAQAQESAKRERDFAAEQSQLRLDADTARDRAELALSVVRERESELRESLARNLLAQGVRASRSGDYVNGLLSLAQASKTIGAGKPLQNSAYRLIDGWNQHDLLNFYHPSITYGQELYGPTAELNLDGTRLVTRCVPGFTFIWNATDGSLVAGPMNTPYGFRLDPSGRYVLTSLGDRKFRCNLLADGKFLWEISADTTLGNLVFSADGERVAVADMNQIHFLRMQDGQPTAAAAKIKSRIMKLACDKDLQRFAVTGLDRQIRFGNASTGKWVGKPVPYEGVMYGLAFLGDRCVARDRQGVRIVSSDGMPLSSPIAGNPHFPSDKDHLLISSQNRSQWVDVEDGKIIAEYDDAYAANRAVLPCEVFSPDGSWFVLTNSDNTKIFFGAADRPTQALVALPIQGSFLGGAWDPTGQFFLTVTTEEAPASGSRRSPEAIQSTILRTWEAASGQPIGPPIFLNDGLPRAFLLDGGRRLVVGTSNGTIRTWDTKLGTPVSTPVRLGSELGAMQNASDHQTFILQCRDRTVRLLRLALESPTPIETRLEMTAAAVHPESEVLATATEGSWAVQLRSAVDGRLIGKPMQQGARINSIAFSETGRSVATAGDDHCAYAWDVKTQERIAGPLWHRGRVLCVAFGAGENRLVTGTDLGEVVLWDCQTGQRIAAASHLDSVGSIAIDPQGGRLLTGSEDETARVWDLKSLEPLSAPLRHGNPVNCVCFDSVGKGFLTATSNIRFWSENFQPFGDPVQLGSPVTGLSLSDRGDELLAVASDNRLSVWDPLSRLPLGPSRQEAYAVRSIVAMPQNQGFALICNDGRLRSWTTPMDIRPDDKRLQLWLKVLTTLDMEQTHRERLSFEQWFEARQALNAFPRPKQNRRGPTELLQLTPAVESKALNRNCDQVHIKLRAIVAAMHRSSPSQEFRKMQLPAYANFDEDGKPLLSWRVHLLPKLGLHSLYKRFKLDEAWDSENNLPLVNAIPAIYVHPSSRVKNEGKTCFVVPRGEGTCFNEPEGLPFLKILDGTSNTIAVITVDDKHAVPWTQPEDIEVMESDPRAAMSGWIPGRCQAALVDGSTRTLPCGVPDRIFPLNIFRRYFTHAGRMPVPVDAMPSLEEAMDEVLEQSSSPNDWKRLVADAKEMVSRNPSNPKYQDLLVECYIRSGTYDRAKEILKRLEMENADPHAHWWAYQLSIASLATDDFKSHQDTCRRMLKKLDGQSDPMCRILTAFAAAAVPETLSGDQYSTLANKLQSVDKQSSMAAFLRAGRHEESLSIFQSILELGNADSFCWTIAAINYAALGDREKAIAARNNAIANKRRGESASSWRSDQVYQTLQLELKRRMVDLGISLH
ncbi:MAG: protein kinase [Planctomycetota bacterium]